MSDISLREITSQEITEIQSHDNHWYAGEKLGHEPNRNEAAKHYIENHGPENLRQRLSDSTNQNSPCHYGLFFLSLFSLLDSFILWVYIHNMLS